MATTCESIIADIRKKAYRPVYFLAGEEPYYIDVISRFIEENVLTPEERDFNQNIVYGDDTTITGIIELARRFPMMASHQVIIVREAQTVKKIEDLAIYLDNPLLSTILVINYKYRKLDKRTRLYKLLEEKGVFFESPRLYEYQVPGWINHYLMGRGVKIEPEAGQLLTEYLGTDLGKIANELDKLIISLPKANPVVNMAIVGKSIGISKDYNNFELQKAIGERNIEKANLIIKYFAQNPKDNPVILTLSVLFSYFSRVLMYHSLKDRTKNSVAAALKVNPFFVREYETAARNYSVSKTVSVISLLRLYDMRSKGVGDGGTDHGDLLKELVYRIMH
ncbi:MAG: DNA polymerase III subunit delta [Bacteroidales bacterium]|jgi:DNA polymerase-3 subunit delta|nr:DNA polymerase III subunit delta [Bacteroidales bacterium]